MTGVDATYIEAAFASIEADYGSIKAYLERGGWDARRCAALADRLAA